MCKIFFCNYVDIFNWNKLQIERGCPTIEVFYIIYKFTFTFLSHKNKQRQKYYKQCSNSVK